MFKLPNWLDLLVLLLLLITLPLFFYKLGQSSLVSWDEAWYAEIARNILKTGDLFNLTWNSWSYYDHPPLGFWLIALTFKIFGISDFWARFAPATAGFLALIALYFLGKELFNKTVGLASALALASSFWFLYRARSGNLDSFLTLFFIATFLFAWLSLKNKKFLLPFSLSLALLFLTKSLVPFTIIPSLVIIFWGRKPFKLKDCLLPVTIFLIVVGSWFLTQFLGKSNFIERYLSIGFPQAKVQTNYLENLKLFKEYLHSGIGKWFWPGIGAVFGSLLLLQKRFLVLSIFLLTFFLPFLFSHKGQIWHLIPMHPFLILLFFGCFYFVLEKVAKQKVLASIFVLGVAGYFSFTQIRQIWYQFIDIPAYVSDEAILSKEAGKFTEDFFIDGGDFGPTAVFYSGKNVKKVWEGGLADLFRDNSAFVLITHQWRLDQANISPAQYRIIKSDRDKLLILRN